MSVIEAEKKLKKLGFEVATKTKEVASSEVKKGKIVDTSPAIGRTVKEHTVITLIVSSGTDKITIENYVNKDIETVKYLLEKQGLKVNVEDKEVTKDDNIEEGTILEQDIKEKEKLSKGDIITFKVAKVIVVYPDFVNENYTLDEVATFCEDNGVTLNSTAKETNDYPENSIISQSRQAGTKVVNGVTLRVTYAKKKPEEPKQEEKKEETKTEEKNIDDKTENKKEETKTEEKSE